MKVSIFTALLWLSVLLPIAEVATFVYLWRGTLLSPWWFGTIGIFGIYCIMVMCVYSTLTNIGISGAPSGSGQVIDPLALEFMRAIVTGVVGGMGLLWVLRRIFS